MSVEYKNLRRVNKGRPHGFYSFLIYGHSAFFLPGGGASLPGVSETVNNSLPLHLPSSGSPAVVHKHPGICDPLVENYWFA